MATLGKGRTSHDGAPESARTGPRSRSGPLRGHLPLVGREGDLEALRGALSGARAGRPSFQVLSGAPGVGKSRLAATFAEEARHSGCSVATGRAYPAESNAPYSLLADAFVPLLRELEPARLSVLARGTEARLVSLFPALALDRPRPSDPAPADRAELFWTFAEVVRALAGRTPVVLVLDDLHAADSASLELLHFLLRQLGGSPVLVLATANDAERAGHPTLGVTLNSLLSLGLFTERRVEPLGPEGTHAFVRAAFGVDERVSRDFALRVHGWTRGNPYFIEETLSALVDTGQLVRNGGSWVGWEVSELRMPTSVRDALGVRFARLSEGARRLAEVLAVVGQPAAYDLLLDLTGVEEAAFVQSLDELREHGVLIEGGTQRQPVYDLQHPMLRQTLLADVGLARQRLLHGQIAEALERRYGADAPRHADELARHFARANVRALSGRAAVHLAAAGRNALARFADREAMDYLEAALEHLEENASDVEPDAETGADAPARYVVLSDLARARERVGDFDSAITLRETILDVAEQTGRGDLAAATLRRIGLSHVRAGRPDEGIRACERALAGTRAAVPSRGAASARLLRGSALHAVGRVGEARSDLDAALADAEALDDARLRARCHRALLVFHTLAGPAELAREHGEHALELALATGDLALACSCHWALAVMEGFTGHGARCDHHTRESVRIAEALGSPLLRLAADEVQVEHAFGRGDWDTGLALGERAIALARALGQKGILPRLLVWTALIHLGRGDEEKARTYLDESWDLSGAGDPERAWDVHAVVPAHIGLANYHMTRWEWDDAIAVGRRALAIVDRTGYTVWAVHRLLPIIAEAQLLKRDVEGARATVARLRRGAEALGHPLGLAWAETGDAVAEYLEGDVGKSIDMLRAAAERLEAIPFVPDAARVRRQLAGRLADLGERAAAVRELRRVHEIFVRLGAARELEKVRIQFQEMGVRPPARTSGGGNETLTERELEIVRLVAERRSNKAIGKTLGISPRTVGTHLSNVYGKLDVHTRLELAGIAPALLAELDVPAS